MSAEGKIGFPSRVPKPENLVNPDICHLPKPKFNIVKTRIFRTKIEWKVCLEVHELWIFKAISACHSQSRTDDCSFTSLRLTQC